MTCDNFNNETQKSIEKIDSAEILPMYKFIHETDEERYFEGIEVYQSLYNKDFVSVLDYLKDYTLVFDESEEVYANTNILRQNFDKQIQEDTELKLRLMA